MRVMEIRIARGARRLVGLIGRRDPGVAVLLPRCRSVHTFGMRCVLDLVWLDAEGVVVRVDRGVRPWRVRSCRAAAAVIEVPWRGFEPSSRPAEELAAVLAERGLDVGAGGV
jgi:uncharacterized membrane protein (UPF0127 family)